MSGQTSCLNTSPGYYTAAYGSFIPTPASLGYYVNTTGATSQIACLPGTYQNQTAQTSCIDTDAGYYTSSSGSPAQIPCSNGTYQPNTNQESCILSSPGYHVPNTASSTHAVNDVDSSLNSFLSTGEWKHGKRTKDQWTLWAHYGSISKAVKNHPDLFTVDGRPGPLTYEIELYQGCVRFKRGCKFCIEPPQMRLLMI